MKPPSRLTCAQCERMVQDALDATLGPEDQAQFDFHLPSCPACAKALEDAQRGAAWMEMLKVAPPEPPASMVDRILAQTSGDPSVALPVLRADTILHPVPGNVLPFRVPVARSVWARLPMMAQPRFAMTAAMAFFSVALTMNITGVHLSDVHPSDLRPSALRHSFWGANARVVRYYDNLRVVYELQSRVRELQRENNDAGDRAPAARPAEENTAPAKVPEPQKRKDPKGGEPRSGDPAAARPEPGKHHALAESAWASDSPQLVQWHTRKVKNTATRGEGERA